MKLQLNTWLHFPFWKCFFYGLFSNIVQSSWPVWPNQFHPPPINSYSSWIDPKFNHHPVIYTPHNNPYHQPPLPLPYHHHNYHNYQSNNDYINYDASIQTLENKENYPLPSVNHTTSFKVSHPSVRHVAIKSGDKKPNLMLYQAPPSYDRINHPPPSILITSKPFLLTSTTGKRPDFVTGEVKLAASPNVQFSPESNIAVEGNGPNWNTAVTLQVSLRPGSWTKSNRPTIPDKMKQFLPELKYYKKGLKSVNVNQIKSKVEKYVLVSKKDDMNQEMTQPPITVMANDLIIYPQGSTQDATEELKPSDEWENDSEEEHHFIPHDESLMASIDMFTHAPSSEKPTMKTPTKSIEDIVKEVFATVIPSIDENSQEKSSSLKEKGLSDLFDLIYNKSNVSFTTEEVDREEKWLKMEPKKREEKNNTFDLITAPPGFAPLPGLSKVITVGIRPSDVNVTTTITSLETTTSTTTASTTTPYSKSSSGTLEDMTVRCQGFWCHHSTTELQPVALESQQKRGETGNEINPYDNDGPQGLLDYLGLAWPQHDWQSKTTTTTVQPTNLPLVVNVTSTTIAFETSSKLVTTSTPPTHYRNNDVVTLIPGGDNLPNYKELKDFKHKYNEINASAPSVTQVSRKHLVEIFNAMGHGVGQVMSIVMPLAFPVQNQKNLKGSEPGMDFESFFSDSENFD